MRLATLPPGYVFNEFLGMRWIPLELAPYFVQYHVESKVSFQCMFKLVLRPTNTAITSSVLNISCANY